MLPTLCHFHGLERLLIMHASPLSSAKADEQTSRHAYRLLVTSRETVIVGWLQLPPKPVPACRPEHEISRQLA